MVHFITLFLGLFHHIMPMAGPGGMESLLLTPAAATVAALGNLS